MYDVYTEGTKKPANTVLPHWSSIEGGEEMKTVMLEMAEFMDEMAKSFSKEQRSLWDSNYSFENNVFIQLRKLNGFPVQSLRLWRRDS